MDAKDAKTPNFDLGIMRENHCESLPKFPLVMSGQDFINKGFTPILAFRSEDLIVFVDGDDWVDVAMR